MKFVRGRGEARYLPSRFNFALFRLFAHLRIRFAKPQPSDEILVIDRHQSAFETWAVLLWMLLSSTCFAAATWFAGCTLPLALFLGAIVTLTLVQLAGPVLGVFLWPLFRRVTGTTMIPYRFNGVVVMGIFIAAAAYCATRPTWVRFVGRQVLALVALNAIAAAIVLLLRGGSESEP